jgi:hypothetical protein
LFGANGKQDHKQAKQADEKAGTSKLNVRGEH